jgi:hypothetical protein
MGQPCPFHALFEKQNPSGGKFEKKIQGGKFEKSYKLR